jgi:hypothetical protein
MLRRDQQLTVLLFFAAISTAFGLQPVVAERKQEELPAGQNILWVDPGDVASLDFKYGVGGPDGQPQPPFEFVDEDLSGTTPKINVTDDRGQNWNVKWGEEAGPSTFCTRLIWACGYHAAPEYFCECALSIAQRFAKVFGGSALDLGEESVFGHTSDPGSQDPNTARFQLGP